MSTADLAPAAGRGVPRRVIWADLAGGVFLALVMGCAFLLTRDWDHDAAIFPRGVSLGGFVLGIALAVRSLIGSSEAPKTVDPEEADQDLDYVFHTATPREWATTLLWFAGFFVALYVLGLYAASIVFPVLYLKREDNRSWIFAGAYALVLTAVLYLAFAVVLVQPVPAGLLGSG